MKDINPLLPQMRLFLNFLDSMLEEQNFKMNLLILEIYGILIDRLRVRYLVPVLPSTRKSEVIIHFHFFRAK
jgi:hypothetical protein